MINDDNLHVYVIFCLCTPYAIKMEQGGGPRTLSHPGRIPHDCDGQADGNPIWKLGHAGRLHTIYIACHGLPGLRAVSQYPHQQRAGVAGVVDATVRSALESQPS